MNHAKSLKRIIGKAFPVEKNNNFGRKGLSGKKVFEKAAEALFLVCAFISVLSIIVISIFIIRNGMPGFIKIGLKDFLTGTQWRPTIGLYGILPMIIGSVYATAGAIMLGVPIGVLTAIFLAEIAPGKLSMVVKPAVELLAGIPSVIYGFFGLVIFVPLIRKHVGGPGNSLLAACLILGTMILPTIINISFTSLKAVPVSYKEASLALGASHVQTVFKVVLPAAKSGIIAAIILGIGRAVGETMAVILVAGNSAMIPRALTQPIRTLTGNVALEMSYAFGVHREALFATGVVLFIFIMLLNILIHIILKKPQKG